MKYYSLEFIKSTLRESFVIFVLAVIIGAGFKLGWLLIGGS